VTCENSESIEPGHYASYIDLIVSAPSETMSGVLANHVSVEGGGLAAASTVQETPIGETAKFEVNEFAFQPGVSGAVAVSQAGAHPWELTTSFGIPTTNGPLENTGEKHFFKAPQNIKTVQVELPVGFLGDPLATERCTEAVLREKNGCAKKYPHSAVGVFGVVLTGEREAEFSYTGDLTPSPCCSDIYNLVPQAGYPAEFGFTYAETIPLVMYASLVHTGTGYRVRVTVPGVPNEAYAAVESTVTFFGEPGMMNGSGSKAAFLSAPSDCSAESEDIWGSVASGVGGTAKGSAARIEMTPWSEPGNVKTAETAGYPALTGCSALQFDPSLSFGPSPAGSGPEQEGTSEADEPSAYSVGLKLPQTSEFSELATADLKTSTVALPAGVSASASSATGLAGCEAEGPEGINIGSNDIGPRGADLGDPEATELGEGHAGPGGNNSPYDDGFYHTAKGHCPEASIVGSVEVCTPLLPNLANEKGEKVEGETYCEDHPGVAPLSGHVYLAAPECGGAGQPECNDAYAEGKGGPSGTGKLFGLYLEVEGDGVIAKLPGTVAANPTTGQLTGTFKEAPQLAFGQLKLHFKGGARAPIANPQTCGTYTTTSVLEPWSHREANGSAGTPDATPSSSFGIGGCASTMPFNPSLIAHTTDPAAGSYSPFVLSFSRGDREQDFSGLTETMPPGLVGKIAGIPLCGEAQANAGTCGPESQVGSTSALAGPGPEPFLDTGGRVYLTGPYGGGAFGLSIVVPTKAGPFNLGNEVIRAGIHINPDTAQVTVTTNPLPQSKDGVPFRLRTVTTEIGRSSFIENGTNCGASAITGTLSADLPNGSPGSTAAVSIPYQSTGCQNLKFAPQLTASTQGNGTTKGNGASLTVKISAKQGPAQPAGQEEANIAKVDTSLPLALSSRLTTLHKACTEQQFAANPAGCPAGASVGIAVVHTPLLNVPLMGPAILVSHGGRAFPDLDIILQGEGVTIDLVGNTDIKKGITYTKFESSPDAPFSSFELKLPEKENSILAAVKNLCETKLVMPSEITAQNGALMKQSTHIAATGCSGSLSVLSSKAKNGTLTLSVYAPGAGKVTTSAKGLSSDVKTYSGTEALTFKLKQKKAGKLATKIKLTFTPKTGKKQSKSLSVKFKK
jgi:hypothetical protein